MNMRRIAAGALAGVMTLSMMTGCGMNKEAIVTRLGNRTVKLGLVNFMVRYEQAAMDDLYTEYFGGPVWDQDLYGNGSTMTEETISSVMSTLHELMTISEEAHMQEYGVIITEEDTAAIDTAVADFMAANSGEALKEMGAAKEYVAEMLRLFTIKSRMHQAIIDAADVTVSDEEANMRGFTLVSANFSSYYDSEEGSYVSYSEEESAKIKENMQALADAAAAGTSLEEAAEAHDLTTSYRTYNMISDTVLDETLKAAVDALAEGEVSPVIETETMVYVARLDQETDEEATQNNLDSLFASREEDAYRELVEQWQEGDGFDANVNAEKLSEIRIKNYFTQKTDEAEASVESETTEAQ